MAVPSWHSRAKYSTPSALIGSSDCRIILNYLKISLFITQMSHLSNFSMILSISRITIMTQIAMIVLLGLFLIGRKLTNQKPLMLAQNENQSKRLSKSRFDKLFSIRLLLLQLQKHVSRRSRHRYPGKGHPDKKQFCSGEQSGKPWQ